MYLQLNHKNLDVYIVSKAFVIECYRITKNFPKQEQYALTRQIRRAATSILLNIAEGSSRKSSSERSRFYEISRGSLIEIDAAFEIAFELGYFQNEDLSRTKPLMVSSFKLLCKMIDP